jgi:hypothetical protein
VETAHDPPASNPQGAVEEMSTEMRRKRVQGAETRVNITSLGSGDRVELYTARSAYVFFVEFADLAIGVAQGGVLPSPSRVRLTAEGTASAEAPTRPLAVGERAQFEILDPRGRALRRFLTTPLTGLAVRRRKSAAA